MSEIEQTAGESDGLREVPAEIGEYRKFVADGGLAHNDQVIGRKEALKAAQAAGVLPPEDDTTGDDDKTDDDKADEKHKRNGFQARVMRLQRRIGERDQQIADLRKKVEAQGPGTDSEAPAPKAPTSAPAASTVNGRAPEERGREAANGSRPDAEVKPPPPARPKEEDFSSYGDFVEALTDWKTDRKLEAVETARAAEADKRAAAAKGKAIEDAHNKRVDAAKARYGGDWAAAFKGLSDNSFTDAMFLFISESEAGPDITYHLATHRDELERLGKLSPPRQIAELGKIESRFEAAAAAEEEDEPEAEKEAKPEKKPEPRRAPRSQAPPPAAPLSGRASNPDEMPDPKDFNAYEAWARRQATKKTKR